LDLKALEEEPIQRESIEAETSSRDLISTFVQPEVRLGAVVARSAGMKEGLMKLEEMATMTTLVPLVKGSTERVGRREPGLNC
jgi:hypothetical protein